MDSEVGKFSRKETMKGGGREKGRDVAKLVEPLPGMHKTLYSTISITQSHTWGCAPVIPALSQEVEARESKVQDHP